jgi:hypothetical protein
LSAVLVLPVDIFEIERIEKSAFCESALKLIVIPLSVIVLSESSFGECKPLESVMFETGSRRERIEASAFSESGLKSIEIPSSVIVLSESSFRWCKSLESVVFESGRDCNELRNQRFRKVD